MNIIKPKKLNKGDTIGILATSGCIDDDSSLINAKDYFINNGFNVVLSPNVYSKSKYLAGDDTTKIMELHNFFLNPEINAIICLRGGYGAIRLVKNIDYKIIKNNPKIFCGYSDITALSLMFLKNASLMTYSAPMIQSDFGIIPQNEFTMNSFFEAINSDMICYKGNKIYKNGIAKGILWGGNLSTVVSLCGLDFIPDDDFIFYTEDINEPVYKIDKMFNQLFNIDKFKNNIKGIILGDFIDIDRNDWLNELFNELAFKFDIPVVGGFRISHAIEKITLPCGANAVLSENMLHITK